jgi:hypothetical protein
MSETDQGANDLNPTLRYVQTEEILTLSNEHDTFPRYADAVLFLAILGYREDSTTSSDMEELEGSRETIDYKVFGNTELYPEILASLAFSHTGDPDILADRRRQLDILKKYIAAGHRVMEREFGGIKGEPTDAMINFLQSYEVDDQADDGVLQTILGDFDEDPRL